MASEPPLPPVADRRAPERRSYEPRDVDRVNLADLARAAGPAICGGLAVLFIFFWGLGAIDVTDAVAASVVAVVLALIWLASYLYRGRREEPLVVRRDRERRGF